MADDVATFMIEDAALIFRNFAGKEGPYNRKDDRNFAIRLTPEIALDLEDQGWKVKTQEPREEGDDPTLFIKVKIGYKIRPPRVVLLTNDGKTRTPLSEKELDVLDYADIKTADVVCRAYEWVHGDKTGRAAYLQTLFVTINEDPLERKYHIYDDPIEEDG
jgi:hypothetical protein